MRSIVAVLLAGLLAACGDDGDGDGGGGGGGSNVSITGSPTLSGTYTNGSAIRAAGSCTLSDPDVGTFTTGFATAIVAVSTSPDLCSALLAGRDVANATSVGIVLVRQNISGASLTITPRTYPIWDFTTAPPFESLDTIAYAFVLAARNGGAQAGECAVVTDAASASGSVTITGVSDTSIAGTLDVTFDAASGGGRVQGSFTGPTCGSTFSVDPATCDVNVPISTTCS